MSVGLGMMPGMNPLGNLDRAATAVSKIVGTVRPDQFGLPTACTEWTVREVVNHLAHGNAKAVSWAGAGELPQEQDCLGDDPAVAFERSVRELRAALGEPGVFERTVTTPLGSVPAVVLVLMRVNEYLAHGWDIANATGQSTDIEPELAEQALADWHERFGTGPRPPGGPFAPEKPAPPDASAADRLAAFLGRE